MRFITLITALTLSACASGPPSEFSSVNSAVNSYEYQHDVADVWKTPEQFYADGGGDCEDFAKAKGALIDPEHKRELLVMSDLWNGGYHAVLIIDDEWILDNKEPDVYSAHDTWFTNRYSPIVQCNIESFKNSCMTEKNRVN